MDRFLLCVFVRGGKTCISYLEKVLANVWGTEPSLSMWLMRQFKQRNCCFIHLKLKKVFLYISLCIFAHLFLLLLGVRWMTSRILKILLKKDSKMGLTPLSFTCVEIHIKWSKGFVSLVRRICPQPLRSQAATTICQWTATLRWVF